MSYLTSEDILKVIGELKPSGLPLTATPITDYYLLQSQYSMFHVEEASEDISTEGMELI